MAKQVYNRKGKIITQALNPELERLSRLNGLTVRENAKALGIPLRSKDCTTKQLPGYISRVKQEVRRLENVDTATARGFQPSVIGGYKC